MSDFTLYRFFDADDQLLYIGKTINPRRRWREHEKTKDWFSLVATVRRQVLATAAELDAAEVVAIKAERPLHNVAHNGAGIASPARASQSRVIRSDQVDDVLASMWVAEGHCSEEGGVIRLIPPVECAAGEIESDCLCLKCHRVRLAEIERAEVFAEGNDAALHALRQIVNELPTSDLYEWSWEILDFTFVLALQMRAVSVEHPAPAFAEWADGVLAVDCPFCLATHEHLITSGQAVKPMTPACCLNGESSYLPVLDYLEATESYVDWCSRNFTALAGAA